MKTIGDRRPVCAFCDGSGLWPDVDGEVVPDPCPLCEGSGCEPERAATATEDAAEPVALGRLLALLGRLTQPERQHLYEELHARYDCRIYRR